MESKEMMCFYDEPTFSVGPHQRKYWVRDFEENRKEIFNTCVYLKLNIITSFENILSFSLTFDNFSADDVSDFLNASICQIFEKISGRGPIFLILDNCPKNRTDGIKTLSNNNRVILVYTTPTTPQHNFVESIF